MPGWGWIALGYAWYLAITARCMRRFAAARGRALTAALVATVMAVGLNAAYDALPGLAQVWLPLPVLLTGYWLSGLFFVQPMPELERRLLQMDHRLLTGTGLRQWQRRHPAMARLFELAYLLVYVVVPAGAAVVAWTGGLDAIERFWAIVLLAAFACYGMLPWVQTRPPRAIEPDAEAMSPVRLLNLAILERGSIQANTFPSGHTASAVAVALAVGLTAPIAGPLFLLLAATITVATVWGRYHFVLDALLGAAVGAAAFTLVTLAGPGRS